MNSEHCEEIDIAHESWTQSFLLKQIHNKNICSRLSGSFTISIALMPTELASRVFSSETLLEGLAVVKAEIGMDDLSGVDIAQMEQELKDLEACPKCDPVPNEW